ncbi:triple tyrosine motif-containing protein [Dysgonomonas sp. 520]|uniref:helix-turn-helix and ligand-binding sensor domain-containing protein n=1 Tax=Dysgonomonas sp. 520 TaxID=2302931 RepID=UPI0013CFB850|nr:triple tyrosine motif-containing protein [Dysgonomonas sp. 520]NDW08740.1 hypothetical protein [Dysgonomonas sp. 520]
MKKFAVICLVIILFPINIYAIYPSVRNFEKRDTKAGTQSWDIIQYQNNWIYFANNNGLLEFDGNRWAIYPIGNHTNVRTLYYDKQEDRIYAGAHNEFGYYARNEYGILSYHSLVDKIPSSDKEFREIWKIHKIDDAVFFRGENEVFCYKADQIKRINYPNKIDCSNVIYNILWIASGNDGVSMLNGDIFLPLPNSDILKGKRICAILPYSKDDILFVTDFHGIFIFDGEKVMPFQTDIDEFMKENQVFCAAINDSKLAIGTVMNGLVVKDLKNNSNVYSNIHSGLQNNTILSLAFDRQNNLWLGLDKGIDYVMINSPIYDLFGNDQQYGSGYASFIKGNTLYLGTNQGLYATSYPLRTTPEPLNVRLINRMQGQVWCLTEIDNTLFCGTDHGLFIINGNEAKQLHGISGTWAIKELKSHPGHIIGSSYQGFFILKKVNNEWKFSNNINNYTDNGGMFEIDNDGSIWFSHWLKGISKLRLNDALDSVESESFGTNKGLYTDRENAVFKIDNKIIISSSGGFFEYDKTNNNLKHSDKMENLFSIQPNSVRLYESPKGDIWCVTANSLNVANRKPNGNFVLNTSTFSSLKEKLNSGFENFNQINDSTMIISTTDGFAWLDLKGRSSNIPDMFKVAIRNIFITNENDSIVGGYQIAQNEIPEFSYSHNSIRFEFVAPEFRNDNSVSYSFILENYDTDWSQYSSVNVKEYTKLPKGTYTFRVRAQSQLGQEVVETAFEFTILPPWYESPLALFVYALLSLFLIILLFLFVKKKSEKGARMMEAQKQKEMDEQEERFLEEQREKEKEIIALKNQRLQYDLRHKSQELASSTMNLIRKNEILQEINENIDKISSALKNSDESTDIKKKLIKMQHDIKLNIERDDNWKKFEENFDMVYENYLKRLSERFSSLTVNDKKLCAYLKMGLSSKEIAPLLNMTFRSVEMSRYRLRKKMDLERDVNLTDFLQNF